MNFKDRASLVISLAAFVLSGISSYFTFFKVSTEARAVITNYKSDTQKGGIVASVATQNRP